MRSLLWVVELPAISRSTRKRSRYRPLGRRAVCWIGRKSAFREFQRKSGQGLTFPMPLTGQTVDLPEPVGVEGYTVILRNAWGQ